MDTPLLLTKFYPPPQADSWLPRERLFARLNSESLGRPLTLISAPAGSGKSTLISDWLHHFQGEKTANFSWLSLEPSDNDPQRFFRYMITAWQRICPKAGEAALLEVQSPQLPSVETLATYLLNDLFVAQQNSDPYQHHILVLDDYHHIETSPAHTFLCYLIEHLPGSYHLIVISRVDPPLPLPRWRSNGKMSELRDSDLRFTPREASAFLCQAMHLGLSGEEVEVLASKTEGWIVGLQMAALSMQRQENPQGFLQAFERSQRYVLDYLVEEVINQQPEDIQEFLLATSVLDQLCGPLCDALLEKPALFSQRTLEHLEKANLFLTPLDAERNWYRYHQLFAGLLRVRLRQTAPERIPVLHKRAAEWYAQNNLWREAILSCLQSKDYERSVRLFEQAVLAGRLDFLFGGVRPLLEPFPTDWIHTHWVLSLAKAVTMIESSQLAGCETLLRSAENNLQALAPFEGRTDFLGFVYVVQSAVASLLGNSPWIIEASRHVPELLPNDYQANNDALIQIGNVYFYEGNLRQADASWHQALEVSQLHDYVFGILTNLDDLGRLCGCKGELNRAEKLFQQALRLVQQASNPPMRWLGAIQRDYSDLLRERNRLDKALEMIKDGLALCEKWEMVSGIGLGYIHLGRILHARGDMLGAKEALQHSEQLCVTHTVYPDLIAQMHIFRAQLRAAEGDLDSAINDLESCLQTEFCQHELHREWVLIILARLLVRKNLPAKALTLLDGRLEAAEAHGRGRNWLEMLLIETLALDRLGREAEAYALLIEAIRYAFPEGFVRIFLDEGPAMQRLLIRQRARTEMPAERDYIDNLLRAFLSPDKEYNPEKEALAEPLTEREEEILRLLCDGLSNQEIAARLVVSVGTIKTHVHNIIGKLGVRDRLQAVTKARGWLKIE